MSNGHLPLSSQSVAAGPLVPHVAVVIVTYNSRNHLADLWASIRAQSYPAVDLIVVDSNSADDTVRWLHAHEVGEASPAVQIVRSPTNLGYRRGNQLGMERALRGREGGTAPDYLLVLNDDVELHPYAVERMVELAESDRRVGVVAPAILLHQHAERLNAAGSALLPSGFYAARGKNHRYQQYRQRKEIAAASGCCFLLRASVYQEIGGFDAIFDSLPGGWHASAEDLDLCWRVWRAGYTVLYEPKAILWHKYQQRPMHPSRFASLVCGRLAFLSLNFPGRQLLWLSPLLAITEVLLGAYSCLRGPRFLRAWLDGYRWLLGNRRRLRELRGTRAARFQSPRWLIRLLDPAIPLMPALERNGFLRAASRLWFILNATFLGAAKLGAARFSAANLLGMLRPSPNWRPRQEGGA